MALFAGTAARRPIRWLIDRAALVATAQLLAGAVALPFVLATLTSASWPRRSLLFLHALVYGCVGVLLRFVVHAEERARTLGMLLLCTGAVFAAGSIRDAQELSGTLLAPLALVFALRVDALTPYVAWRFVSDFPHVPDSRRSLRVLQVLRASSLALSALLIAAGLVEAASGASTGPLSFLMRGASRSYYFQLQYLFVFAAFVTLVVRARRASLDERRRASLLVGGIVLGGLPTIVWIILWTVIPGFGDAVPLRVAGWVIYPALLAVPTIAAYAVVAQRAFGVALLFRRAIEHALSRYAILLLLSAPAVGLIIELYRHRAERLGDAVSPRTGWLALLLIGATALGLLYHKVLLDRIDRAFFRERYDARHLTAQLVEDCRWVATREELAALLADGLDRVLHVDGVRLFLRDSGRAQFTPVVGQAASLALHSPLATYVSAAEESFEFAVDGPPPRALSESDVAWLIDGRVRCLVPLHDARSVLLGFIALGAKRSGIPFSSDDRSLLKAVARATELALAYHELVDEPARAQAEVGTRESMTQECTSCGLVVAGVAERCPACAGSLVDCLLPAAVGGNLKLVARVGGGGMGTVYRALDVDLGRSVALKTLPYASPDAATRLRREAHIMATLEHEAVASVYAVHSWQGRPVVVYEFLGEGTLADRIVRGPLPILDVVSIGIAIADGLSAIHAAGLLHGDIKPSNIGFSSNGRPKLLDFGIAAPVQTLGERSDHPSQVGTLAYLAPEVARGGAPTFDSDVWSLSLTLFEAASGRQPMIGEDLVDTMRRV
ncbi:MAG TPA: protein kinase [Gemmatimonadaceae bacterium]